MKQHKFGDIDLSDPFLIRLKKIILNSLNGTPKD